MKCSANNKSNLTMNKSTDKGGNVEQCHTKQEDISVTKNVTKSASSHQKATKLSYHTSQQCFYEQTEFGIEDTVRE